MAQTIKICVEDVEGSKKTKIIQLEGELDTLSSKDAEKIISPLSHEAGLNMIIDGSKLTYINTVGLIMLMKYCVKTKRSKGSFVVCNLNPQVKETLDLSGALKIIAVYNNVDDALRGIDSKKE